MIDKNRFEYLKQYIKKCADHEIFPGACFEIVTKEESLFCAEGYYQLMPTKELENVDVIYDLASLSKVISTTTAILKLIEDGKITLVTKVCDIFPNFKHKDITIYNLLTHTSGLPSDICDYKMLCKNKQDIIKFVFSTELEYETGKKVLYSDIGYILLGFIIEKSVGPMDVYFNENIAKPLNMEDTCYNPKENSKVRCAPTEYTYERGYIKGKVHDGKSYILGGVSGHAGLFSTVKDLGNFCKMMLNNGMFNGKRILSKNSIKMIMECNTEGLNEKRGLGWQIRNDLSSINNMGDLASNRSIFHTGFTGTSVLIDFENQFAFILLTNRIHPSRENRELIKLRRNINNIAETVVF
jgi:CubicO group peptidase (beta-lactamase class C family)